MPRALWKPRHALLQQAHPHVRVMGRELSLGGAEQWLQRDSEAGSSCSRDVFFSSALLSSLELSDTKVYAP